MEVSHNHNAKSQLAKLLATENITVQHSPKVKTAWFDLKNRILMLPVWQEMSEDLYDMLVVHEVGHALDTPPENFIPKIAEIARRAAGSVSNRAISAVKDYLNVIEDARIDKRQKRRFPGARRNYIKGYKELIDRDFFGTATRDVNSMLFIDRLNIYFKGGAMLGIKFDREEKAWVRKVEDAETFEEVLTLTEEIFKWAKEQMKDRPEEDQDDFRMKRAAPGMGEDDEDDYEDEDYSYGEDDEDSDEDEEAETSGRGKSKSKEDEDGDEAEGDEDGEESDGDDGDESEVGESSAQDSAGDNGEATHTPEGDDALPESLTEKTWQEKAKELAVDSEVEYVYARIPRIANYDRMVIDYKIVLQEQRAAIGQYRSNDWMQSVAATVNKFRSSEAAAISFMVKEFEMRKSADEYSRTSVSKTGVIDTNKLHSYKYNDDLFRRITTVATGKNHGFVMFVDWSSSMDYNLKKTLKQLFSLVMFCKRVQIPFEVYTFRTINSSDNNRRGDHYTRNKGEFVFNPFKARNILSSRMNMSEMNEAMINLYSIACGNRMECDHMGSTPLNPCIAVAHEIVNRFKAKSKVQVVNVAFLTDGDSDAFDGVINGVPASWQSRKYILQDEITKKSYELPTGRYNSFENKNFTPILLKMLKDRTGCNLMGFFISSGKFDRMYGRYYPGVGGKHFTDAKACWKDNGFFTVTSAGYDEYYILNADTFVIASSTLTVDGKASKKKMISEFIKFAEKKAISRVLLTQIVKRVTA